MTIRSVAEGALLALAALGCTGEARRPDVRLWSDHYAIRITAAPTPPVAREDVIYTVIVQDKDTGSPVDGGEGQLFATSLEHKNAWDSFEPGPQEGTYTARLRFLTAGDWAVAIRFRKDSTSRLERVDWIQGVRAPRAPGA